MKSLLRRYTISTTISILVFCSTVIGLIWFGLLMDAKRNRVLDTKQQLASFDLNRKVLIEESQEFKAIAARLTTLETYRVGDGDTPELLSSLESLAKTYGVEFTITTVQTAVATADAPAKLSIDFSVHGPFSAIQQFVDTLNHQAYQIRFTAFSLLAVTPPVVEPVAGQPVAPVSTVRSWDLLASMEVVSF
jgi:Tfp pilus assembly protein PilO